MANDFATYAANDIEFHAILNYARREGKRAKSVEEKNGHALMEGMMAGKIFANRERAAAECFPYSRRFG